MKYRKKPIIIEAEQFNPISDCETWPEGVEFSVTQDEYYIDTLEGPHLVSDGDWVITGVKGEKYPCKPDIFEMTYERVEP